MSTPAGWRRSRTTQHCSRKWQDSVQVKCVNSTSLCVRHALIEVPFRCTLLHRIAPAASSRLLQHTHPLKVKNSARTFPSLHPFAYSSIPRYLRPRLSLPGESAPVPPLSRTPARLGSTRANPIRSPKGQSAPRIRSSTQIAFEGRSTSRYTKTLHHLHHGDAVATPLRRHPPPSQEALY